MERHRDLAARFLSELRSGNRLTWVYEEGGQFLGEISLVLNKDDPDYTDYKYWKERGWTGKERPWKRRRPAAD